MALEPMATLASNETDPSPLPLNLNEFYLCFSTSGFSLLFPSDQIGFIVLESKLVGRRHYVSYSPVFSSCGT
jgi:hypothetical protein